MPLCDIEVEENKQRLGLRTPLTVSDVFKQSWGWEEQIKVKIKDIVQGEAGLWLVGSRSVVLHPNLKLKLFGLSFMGQVSFGFLWWSGSLVYYIFFFNQIILCNNYNVNGTIGYGWVRICQFEKKRLGFISTFASQHQSVNLSHTIISLKPSFNCKLMYSYLLQKGFAYCLNSFNTNFQLIWLKWYETLNALQTPVYVFNTEK